MKRPCARGGLALLLAAAALLLAPPTAHAQAGAWTDPSPHSSVRVSVQPWVQLEVLDWGGEGEAMVFLPGLGNTAHAFDDFAPRFRKGYHVYGITPRGFGASSRPDSGYDSLTRARDVMTVLDSLGIRRAILVGHSIAGDELSRIGADYPGRVRALVYLDAYSYGADDFHTDLPQPPLRPRPPMTTADSASLTSLADYLSRFYGFRIPEGEILADRALARVGQAVTINGPPNMAGRVLAGTRRSDYAAIRAPALAIYATVVNPRQIFPGYDSYDPTGREEADSLFAADRQWQAGQIRRFRQEVKGGVVVEIPGANHYVHYSNPDQVERVMRDFLERVHAADR